MSRGKDIYLIAGEEDFLKQFELKRIINKFYNEFEIEVFYAEDTDVLKILTSATTYSFTQKRKIIVIKNVEKFDANQKAQLFNFLTQSQKHPSIFILIIKDKAQALKFHSKYKDRSELIYCAPLNNSKLSSWIYQKTREENVKILPDAIELLKEKIGNNLWAMNNTLEQLSIYAKGYSQITPSLVRKIVGKSSKFSVFNLIDNIAKKDLKACLEIYQALLNEKVDFTKIVGILGWQLRRLWHAKQLLKDGHKDKYEIAEILNIRYFENKFFSSLKNFTIEDLEEAIKGLAKLDLEIKTGKRQPAEALQIFIVKLCRNELL